MVNWLKEIDLTGTGPPIAMGVRKLGNRPWIYSDDRKDLELSIKAELTEANDREVFIARADTEQAGYSVVSLIEQAGVEVVNTLDHPLERAGLSIQEDLCLIRRTNEGWILEAASLCFPSRWRLADKIGRNMAAVHEPVDKYQDILEGKVSTFFDRLGTEPVWRRNWFIHPDDSLYQPDRPVGGDPIIPSSDIRENLFVRSERQTLRALELPDWILFTIRVQQTPLKKLIDARMDNFIEWLRKAPESHHRQKGLQAEQVSEILSAVS